MIGVVSALTPEMADRFRVVHGVLPPGFPTAARIGALAFGIVLIWLARSLAQRRRVVRVLDQLDELLPSWANNLSNVYFSHARALPITIGG